MPRAMRRQQNVFAQQRLRSRQPLPVDEVHEDHQRTIKESQFFADNLRTNGYAYISRGDLHAYNSRGYRRADQIANVPDY